MGQTDKTQIRRPVVARNVSIFKRDNETMTILFEGLVLNIKGKNISIFIDYMLPMLNGKNSIEDIVSKMKPYFPEESALKLLSSFREYGIIENGDFANLSEDEVLQYDGSVAYYSKWGRDKLDILKSLGEKSVAVVGLNRLGARIVALLTTLGIGKIVLVDDSNIDSEDTGSIFLKGDVGRPRVQVAIREGVRMNPLIDIQGSSEENLESVIASADLTLVSSAYEYENYTLPKKVNELSLRRNKPWIYGSTRQDGECIIGPFFKPLETACYECMLIRLKSNSDMAEELSAYEEVALNPETINSKVCFDPHVEIAAGFIVNEAWKFLSQLSPLGIASQFYVLNTDVISTEAHYVLRVPRCRSCSSVFAGPYQKLWNDEVIEIERMLLSSG